jgi:class 3 adenylate cyclase
MAGELWTPVHELLGLRFVDVGEGYGDVALPASEWLCARTRQVAEGAIGILVRYALSGAVVGSAGPGLRVGIIDESIDFLRPVLPDGRELLAHGRVVHHVGDFYVSRAEVTDHDGNVVAVGHQMSFLKELRRKEASVERTLATVVFTDIVGSTRRAEELGDAAWQRVLADHDALVRRQLEVWKGREVKTLGDGFLVTFASPARAVQFGRAVGEAVIRLGLELRVGMHTGECEVVANDVAGIAVNVAARVQAAADPGEVLVSSTVRDLVAGSGLRFADRGRHELKGVEGAWQLFAVVD